jgi:hypothetical protein
MSLHASTFEYLKPTDEQVEVMAKVRASFAKCAHEVDELLPEGPDKTYMLRKLREVAMWGNIAVTRQPDGTPRT